jgi:hypothetical protein
MFSAIIGNDTASSDFIAIDDLMRRSGLYVLGKPGMGKSSLLVNLIHSDICNGHGVFFLDPHGDAIQDCLRGKYKYPSFTIILDPENEEYSFGINPLYCRDVTSLRERTDTYTRAFNVFHKIWEEDWGVWLQLIIQNTLYAFIENQDYTLAEVPLFYTNENFRYHLVKNMKYNTDVKDFWLTRFEGKRDIDQQRQVDAALTRISTLLGHPYIKHIVGQKETTVYFPMAMEKRGIILVKLSSALASDMVKFIGTIFLSELLHAVRERPADKRDQFCIFIDEMQNFASSEDLATLITEARKFGIATTLAHQERYGQLGDNKKMLGATLAAANKIFFQLTVKDAQELAPEFADQVQATEKRREAVLVFSPHVVEDMWEKGHPTQKFSDDLLRHKCFFLVDLLKKYPQKTYFTFELPGTNWKSPLPNLFSLDWNAFTDWDLYRSSADMIKQGITLLNEYFLDWMRGKYQKNNRATDEELQILYKVIECLGGVLGFRPTMEPYIPEDMRQILFQRITQKDDRESENKINHYWSSARSLPSNASYAEYSEYYAKIGNNIKRYDPKFSYKTKITDIPDRLLLNQIQFWRDIAVKYDFSQHDLDNLIQWRIRELSGEENYFLKTIIYLVGNIDVAKEEYDKHQNEAGLNYSLAMTAVYMMEQRLEKLSENERHKLTQRIGWQVTELQSFIIYISMSARMLQDYPLKVPSGHYDESLKMERTQIDIVNEMVQELSSLPRFTAYAKILERDTSQKYKMRTREITVKNEGYELNIADDAMSCQTREAIEKEIADRQACWKVGLSTPAQPVKSDAPSPARSSTPPPTRTS